jgi:O-antigen ligase
MSITRQENALNSVGRFALLVSGVASIATLLTIALGPTGCIVVVLGGLVAAVAAYAPGILLAAFLLIPFYKGAVQPYSPVDITAILAALNTLQIIPILLDHRPRHVSRAGMILWVSLAGLVLGGVLYAPDQQLALGHAISYWALVLLPIVPAVLRVGSDPKHVRQFLWAVFGLAVLTVVVGLVIFSRASRLEFFGTNTINTALASLLVPVIGVSFVLREGARSLRIITVALIPAALVVALATGSRGPLLALLALGILWALKRLTRPRSVNWRHAGIGAAVTVASIAVVLVAAATLPTQSTARFVLFGDYVQGILSGRLDTSTADISTGGRIALSQFALSLFQGSPIFGVGSAGFQALTSRIVGPIDAAAYPHNALLQVAAELGVVGLTVFVGMVLLGVLRRFPPDAAFGAIRAVFLFLLVEAMFSGDIFSDRMTWGFLALLLLGHSPPERDRGMTSTDAILRPGVIGCLDVVHGRVADEELHRR